WSWLRLWSRIWPPPWLRLWTLRLWPRLRSWTRPSRLWRLLLKIIQTFGNAGSRSSGPALNAPCGARRKNDVN
ncbi:unnamed protein product, partial [Ixodes pacificus]